MNKSELIEHIAQQADISKAAAGRALDDAIPDAAHRTSQVCSGETNMTMEKSGFALRGRNPDVLNASRRRRIASGSGTDVQEVNRLIKQFRNAQRLMKTMKKTGGKGLSRLFK